MSVRVRTRDNTNTTQINTLLGNPSYLQILNVLAREELTFQELSEFLKRNDERLSHDVDELVKLGMVERHFHHHAVVYTASQSPLKHTVHILYELWAERVRGTEPEYGMKY
ncbi:MAG: winged helix-turn-helix transcriptional regulator [Candidatus Andersenbacteria bacterium]|nr:winged helix-turn-helix transcriptional regulator [Candidatus Andersenbacteria bacterium]